MDKVEYELFEKDDDFQIEGLTLKPDEEACGKFIPVLSLPTEYVLLTTSGLHWVEGDKATFLAYADIKKIDSSKLSKLQIKTIVLITNQSKSINFPKEYEFPVPILFPFSGFIARLVRGYRRRYQLGLSLDTFIKGHMKPLISGGEKPDNSHE